MSDNQQFADYATRTAFNISLSRAQIRMMWWISKKDDNVYCHGWAGVTLMSLARRGLIRKYGRTDRVLRDEPLYELTDAGQLTLALCGLAGLPTEADKATDEAVKTFISDYLARMQ